jgi:hypothetical protein
VAFERLFSHLEHDRQSPLNRVDYPYGHLRGGVSVVCAHGAASVLARAAGAVAHQLVDHPGRDAGVLQPGRVGVPEVVAAVQVHPIQQGSRWTGRAELRPAGSSLVVRRDPAPMTETRATTSTRISELHGFTAIDHYYPVGGVS